MISSVPPENSRGNWQHELFLNGKVASHDLKSIEGQSNALTNIGKCKDLIDCDLHFTGGKKNLRNDGGVGHLDHLHIGVYK